MSLEKNAQDSKKEELLSLQVSFSLVFYIDRYQDKCVQCTNRFIISFYLQKSDPNFQSFWDSLSFIWKHIKCLVWPPIARLHIHKTLNPYIKNQLKNLCFFHDQTFLRDLDLALRRSFCHGGLLSLGACLLQQWWLISICLCAWYDYGKAPNENLYYFVNLTDRRWGVRWGMSPPLAWLNQFTKVLVNR